LPAPPAFATLRRVPLASFHPAVRRWFERAFAGPTPCQRDAWPAIVRRAPVLIAAPTGSGKTLAAFLCALDALVRRGEAGALPDQTEVVYVSPLKALGNDVQRNLEIPLAGINAELEAMGRPCAGIRALVRTGDTPQAVRAAMRRRPPHIVVTTPESLYILLTSPGGRDMLRTTRTVIVDEIHAVAGTKRGSHLALSLERLEALCDAPPVRIGLSATQKPIEDIADFLCGAGPGRDCRIVDTGHVRARDLAIELPASPLEAVMAAEVWSEVYDRIAELVRAHRTTLVFVNTRRMAERVARHLSERLGEEAVTSHHGSLSREQRLDAEQRLKEGRLRALVATASLELGIDVGEVELVCQLGSTRSIATFLQRVGRSGHGIDRLPKGRLFPLSRDELVECLALLEAIGRDELDRIDIPPQPLDVLAQQVVAAVACEEWSEDALFDLVRCARPYHRLERARFDAVVRMLAEGFTTRRGRRNAHLYRDAVNRRLRERPGARLTAITCGGAIPDNAAYEVRCEPGDAFVGTLDEDFAIESLAGDIFQLGNTSWRILRVESGTVRVEDARGEPPTIPFWMGEAPARTTELSQAVAGLRDRIGGLIERCKTPDTIVQTVAGELAKVPGCPPAGARQVAEYLSAAHAVFGALPTRDTLIMERFFDESGGMQLVIHAPFGGRLNRAWGLALRKRFCRQFNFELQAAATEDAIVLSLGETHSFALEEVWAYLKPQSVRDVLVQALLDAPMFAARWRWNASCALAIRRFHNGRKVPARLQRMNAEDLIALVFPDQLACAENLRGRREIPDHPLVEQTIADCLHGAMDVEALEALTADIAAGRKRLIARDLTEPSPLALEILSARPYAFLDDAPLEERRTQAVLSRRWLDPETAADLGRLDPAAIAVVRAEAWPEARDADELHDALMSLCGLADGELERGPAVAGTDGGEAYPIGAGGWRPLMAALVATGRATALRPPAPGPLLWVATERVPLAGAAYPGAVVAPEVRVPEEYATVPWTREDALRELIRGRLGALGPATAAGLSDALGLAAPSVEAALRALEQEGAVLQGRFERNDGAVEWCDRRLLARIHRYTVQRLRREIEPVSSAEYLRFLLDWQHLSAGARLEGPRALTAVVARLDGFEAPAAAWEQELLPARIRDYVPADLDNLCLSGRYIWSRLGAGAAPRGAAPLRSAPIALVARRAFAAWRGPPDGAGDIEAWSAPARAILECIAARGACFLDDLLEDTGLLGTQLEQGLAELAARGRVRSDSFKGLRTLLAPGGRRRGSATRRRGRGTFESGLEDAGRWVATGAEAASAETDLETVARALLERYGVVFRRLLARECVPAPWYALLGVYRRLEARGEIRGGRFVANATGEQFALPEALAELRALRRQPGTGELVSVSAADPVNLIGILTPGPRLPALTGNRLLFRDGAPIALQLGKEIHLLEATRGQSEWQIRNALIRSLRPRPPRGEPRGVRIER
jgi:ATP-dependent Lhr-like helicase